LTGVANNKIGIQGKHTSRGSTNHDGGRHDPCAPRGLTLVMWWVKKKEESLKAHPEEGKQRPGKKKLRKGSVANEKSVQKKMKQIRNTNGGIMKEMFQGEESYKGHKTLV